MGLVCTFLSCIQKLESDEKSVTIFKVILWSVYPVSSEVCYFMHVIETNAYVFIVINTLRTNHKSSKSWAQEVMCLYFCSGGARSESWPWPSLQAFWLFISSIRMSWNRLQQFPESLLRHSTLSSCYLIRPQVMYVAGVASLNNGLSSVCDFSFYCIVTVSVSMIARGRYRGGEITNTLWSYWPLYDNSAVHLPQ